MKILNFNKLLSFTLITGIVLFSSSCKKDEQENPTPNDDNLVLTENYLKINDDYFRISTASNSMYVTDDNNIIRVLGLSHEGANEETDIYIEYSTQNGIVVGQFNYENDCSLFDENYTPNIIYCDGLSGEGERGNINSWFDFGNNENNSGTLTITQSGGTTYSIIFNGVQGDGKKVSIKYNGTW